MDQRTIKLLAALSNPRSRERFARLALSAVPLPRDAADELILSSGVAVAGDAGVRLSPAVIRELLENAREVRAAAQPEPLVERLPKRHAQRVEFLSELAHAVFATDTELDENTLNVRLSAHVTDVAEFRRALIDYDVVRRDAPGRRYWLPETERQ